ncbi:conserved Plasmodium protein, unknown function [Plasmodium knowlesi strain H]|uniref:Uncharacterized protein n=3 Tax=Plasmodium knowlesi TaxID=5850 RepID=A0A5K1V1X9_PLAKH|nr:conserved Plasmodium protein, unknown function [Plasmodium knowlesi strain H]OTN63813.1 Uncharacterized protein PKNOH_S140247600 [Plasmodium knowlesi]CAA9990895.1 conserved Plasmodium protein, unknown function [Plasmodium knowlesi strain H]SBO20881.1 conserved Plasmodium protein, unknown function [Plasmodium knowlesi strain H]SBO21331.1 conserved Plasmodium protein, unknown function [Plasmodium knowlesi strain H]VVS80369.1 conserved Plasmodium protein, unknown function [Plasmodium knowlesi |eukprot:XP_002262181.1 hypothetical protein, conserved in Plasmodium species [Plasmodium knowlesi strain H]
MSDMSTCPLNDFFDIDEENNLDELKKEDTEIYDGSFLSYIYNQFAFCCTNFFDELEKKNKKKNITLKKTFLDDYNKNQKDASQFQVFHKILKRSADLAKEVPLDSKYFNPHADWFECAHEVDIELTKEEVEFCIFNFFLKMYRSELRDKDLLLSIILECLYSRKNFKKEFYSQKAKLKFLKEIKSIEINSFKESLNELINTIENTNFIQINTDQMKNDKFYFKLYVTIQIKYTYGVYIFNCDEVYDIVVIDCNTLNNNIPKIMSFCSLRKFISFLNSIYSTHFTDENVHNSFPIVMYESKECYALSHNHLPLKETVFNNRGRGIFQKRGILNDQGGDEQEQDGQQSQGESHDIAT